MQFGYLRPKRKKCKMREIAKNTKTQPQPTQETRGTKRSKGTPPTQRKRNTTRHQKQHKNNQSKRWGKHLRERLQHDKGNGQRVRGQDTTKNCQTKKTLKFISCRWSVLLNLASLTASHCDDAPTPEDPKQTKQKHLQGRSLKGNRNKIDIPKQQTLMNFPSNIPKHNHENKHKDGTTLKRTPRGASLESRSK